MTLANEFQEKARKQTQELRAQSTPQGGPREHPEDTLVVKNILVGDDTQMHEAIPYATVRDQSKDPRTPIDYDFNRLDNRVYEHEWSTKDYFEVRWDGRPHRIKPGGQRLFPRYLADHFAKVLIDFILTKREEKEKVQGLVKNRTERAKLYRQIIVSVASHYNGDAYESEREGFRVERQIEELNRSPAIDLGEVPNPAMALGTTDDAPQSVEEDDTTPPPATNKEKPSTREDLVASKSRQELMKEAKQLGIEVTPSMTKDQVAAALLNF